MAEWYSGCNYKVLDDGTAYYVDGEDASNFKYHQNTGWFMGNQFNTYVWNDGSKDANYWDKLQHHNDWHSIHRHTDLCGILLNTLHRSQLCRMH